jgi:hypothetical protein
MIFNPAHPGEALRDYLGEMTVAEASKRLGVTCARDSKRAGQSVGGDVTATLGGAWHLTRLLA